MESWVTRRRNRSAERENSKAHNTRVSMGMEDIVDAKLMTAMAGKSEGFGDSTLLAEVDFLSGKSSW